MRVFAVYGHPDAAMLTYYGLFAFTVSDSPPRKAYDFSWTFWAQAKLPSPH